MRIFVQRHTWAIFFENKQGVAVTVKNICFHQESGKCLIAETTLDVLRPVFEDHIISRRADIIWQNRSCDLTPLDYYLCGAVNAV